MKYSALTGAAALLPLKLGLRSAMAFSQSGPLRKWAQTLRGLADIPVLTPQADPVFGSGVDYYKISVGEFTDTLHPDLPATHLWGYFDTVSRVQKHLGGIIVARKDRPCRLRVKNELPPSDMSYPNMNAIVPTDMTSFFMDVMAHGANRVVTHLHGGFTPWLSDGVPGAWYDPYGVKGPSFVNDAIVQNAVGVSPDVKAANQAAPGEADFWYTNAQSARLMWYHDHSHDTTRTNAYAGIATAYVLTSDEEQRTQFFTDFQYGIPLVWQDKIFVSAATSTPSSSAYDPTWFSIMPSRVQGIGSLWYPHVYDPARWRLRAGAKYPTIPDPSCVPEMFGDTMLCNGTVFPVLEVYPQAYRFRMLNACQARFLNISLFEADPTNPDAINLDPATNFPNNYPGPSMVQIGSEGGFLPKPVTLPPAKAVSMLTMTGNLLLAPAERADVIIDFNAYPVGTEIIFYNDAPAPFPMGDPLNDHIGGVDANGNPVGPDTRQILKVRVIQPPAGWLNPGAYAMPTTLPDDQAALKLVKQTPGVPTPIPPGSIVRQLTLNETFDDWGRLLQLLGTTKALRAGTLGRGYMDPATEVVDAGATEVWQIFNMTGDTHPIHTHLTNWQVLSRQPFKLMGGKPVVYGTARAPEDNELGFKETVRMNPGECTTVIANYTLPDVKNYFTVPSCPSPNLKVSLGAGQTTVNEYVWHCHILDHEEHDMMRPLVVRS